MRDHEISGETGNRCSCGFLAETKRELYRHVAQPAAVPSEPTTPALCDVVAQALGYAFEGDTDEWVDGIVTGVTAAVQGWLAARVEVGPSPEQIEALLQQALDDDGSHGLLAVVTYDTNGNSDWFAADDVIARFVELLVAACSVRATPPA